MTFHDAPRFSDKIAYGATSKVIRNVDIATLGSGEEERNATWANSKHQFDVSSGVKSYNDLYAIKEFFEARGGPLYGFRFKDFSDYKSCPPQNATSALDQQIGVGDGALLAFQISKNYTSGAYSYNRKITKIVSGTLKVSVNNVVVVSGWTVNNSTGILTFSAAPSIGHVIKVGFEFDVPVRFESNELDVSLEYYNSGIIPNIILLELKGE